MSYESPPSALRFASRIRFHPEAAACRGEAAPRPYVPVAYPHVIDGLGAI